MIVSRYICKRSLLISIIALARSSRVYRAFQITLVLLAFWGTHSDTTLTSKGCAILKRYLTENLQILLSKASKAREMSTFSATLAASTPHHPRVKVVHRLSDHGFAA